MVTRVGFARLRGLGHATLESLGHGPEKRGAWVGHDAEKPAQLLGHDPEKLLGHGAENRRVMMARNDMAATFLLRHRTVEAVAVLQEAASGDGLLPFEARQTLKRWEEGAWQLDPK